jgi:hypothetical protein
VFLPAVAAEKVVFFFYESLDGIDPFVSSCRSRRGYQFTSPRQPVIHLVEPNEAIQVVQPSILSRSRCHCALHGGKCLSPHRSYTTAICPNDGVLGSDAFVCMTQLEKTQRSWLTGMKEFGQMRGQRQSGMAVLVAFGSQILMGGISAVILFTGNWTGNLWLPAEAFIFRASISEEQRQEFGRLVETTIGQIEAAQFVSHSGIRFPQNGCLTCCHLGLCLNNQQLVDVNLIRKAGASDLDWLDELVD